MDDKDLLEQLTVERDICSELEKRLCRAGWVRLHDPYGGNVWMLPDCRSKWYERMLDSFWGPLLLAFLFALAMTFWVCVSKQ